MSCGVVSDTAGIPSYCGCGCGRQLSLHSTPSLGSSMFQECSHKKQKRKQKQTKKQLAMAFAIAVSSVLKLFFFFLPHLQHMEAPRLGVKSELRLPACVTATAKKQSESTDPSQICGLGMLLWLHLMGYTALWILNPVNEAKDPVCIPTDTM